MVGGGGLIATKLSEERRFSDALGVSGVGGVGDRNVVLACPTTYSVIAPSACSVPGVGGNNAGMPEQIDGMGVNTGGSGNTSRLCLCCGVGVCIRQGGSMAGID